MISIWQCAVASSSWPSRFLASRSPRARLRAAARASHAMQYLHAVASPPTGAHAVLPHRPLSPLISPFFSRTTHRLRPALRRMPLRPQALGRWLLLWQMQRKGLRQQRQRVRARRLRESHNSTLPQPSSWICVSSEASPASSSDWVLVSCRPRPAPDRACLACHPFSFQCSLCIAAISLLLNEPCLLPTPPFPLPQWRRRPAGRQTLDWLRPWQALRKG